MDNNGVHFMMPTVFNDEDSIDIKSMHSVCKFAKNSGCKGLVLLGVMGEAHRLSEHERNFLIEEISQLSKELGLILTIGASAESGYLATSYAATASESGAEQVMVAPPIMKKPNENVLFRYYEDINNSIEKNTRIVIQDLPEQSGVYMSPQFMVDLHKNLDKVNSIKLEDPPTPSKISKIDKLRSKDLKIFGGLGGLFFLEELIRGASGTMTGFAFTEILVEIYNLFSEDKITEAKDVFYKWLPLIRYENTAGISLSIRKEILRKRKITSYSNVRYPSPAMDEDDKKELDFILRDYL
ncbi:MAG: dihydrodipicolinate synthase family protein [Dehalococcoidia bacterium]|nr:dihydrodipicolinate synthase family protein [Dehalococcoidia bacterium]